MANQSNEAPGNPGMPPKWTSSSKSGIGKALNAASSVAFTIGHGILNEIYFPREDIACIRDMGFLVTDGADYFSEEKRDTEHHVKMMKDGIPAYQVKNICGEYELTKEIIADPYRSVVLQKVTFNQKRKGGTLKLFALLAPHLNDQGADNTGWLDGHKGIPMLFARQSDFSLALACSSGWNKRSAGFVGASDGWTDLKQHKNMEWQYDSAHNGNIALTGEVDLSMGNEFIMALAFGNTPQEAAHHARASILDGFEPAKRVYMKEWEDWQTGLRKVDAKNFLTSAAILRMNESKDFSGAIIASLSIPWGESKGDGDSGGYHVVWPRDLVESAGGFLALETGRDVGRIVNYLMSTQNGDGSWPQNMWLQGEPHWGGLQMDQIALPILQLHRSLELKAIDKAAMDRYWPLAKKALAFLIKHGPYTPQERWEEEQGYSPFTLASEVAGLLAGAELAAANGEKDLARFCRETADNWNDNIEKQTYVTGTPLAKEVGVDGYYIRINPYHDVPAAELGDKIINLKNHTGDEGKIKLTDLVSVDALALVRFGLRAADDPKIRNTVKVIDAKLKIDTPSGPCWHRYNNDGYGEHANGDPFDGHGIGRTWPLLTGERGHFEIAAGNKKEAQKLLNCIDAFSSNGFLSEQIWDTDDIPEKGLYFGKHSGSGMPLTWAHAEYLKLCISIADNKIFDMPAQTVERYIKKKTRSKVDIWRFDKQIGSLNPGKKLRIETMAAAEVLWSDDHWTTKQSIKSKDTGIGIFVADIKPKDKKAKTIEFTFHWEKADHWEGDNFSVGIANGK